MNEPLGKDQIIFTSLIISFVIAFVICIIPHFDTSDYHFMPDSNGYGYYSGSNRVSYATYECGFGDKHQLDTENRTVSDLYSSRSNNLIADTFNHFMLMLTVAIVSTIIMAVLWIRLEDQEKFKEIK